MRSPLVAVVAALPEEVGPLRGRLGELRSFKMGGLAAVTGRLGEQRVALAVTGDGQRCARAGIEALLTGLRVDGLLVIGVAGALTDDLGPAALVVAEAVRDAAASYCTNAALMKNAVARVGGQPGTVITAARIADSLEERARLRQAFPTTGPAAVDLESAVYVRAAQARAIPWLVVRAISDTAGEALPAILNQSRDDGGAVRRGALVRGLVAAPSAIPALVRLRWRVGRCANVLAAAAERLVGVWSVAGAAAT